jgi:hypothetical protein
MTKNEEVARNVAQLFDKIHIKYHVKALIDCMDYAIRPTGPGPANNLFSITRAYCRDYDNLVPFMDASAYSASRKGIDPMPARERRFIATALC